MLVDDTIGLLGKESREDDIAAAIDFVKQNPEHRALLLAYLRQQHPIYQGRSANEAIRIRGYLFESFSHTGLVESALPFVLEALETGRHAYVVAGAAIALRGLSTPRPQFVHFLLKAFGNMKFMDDAVSFDAYKPRWPAPNHSTALEEICKTVQWMGSCAAGSIEELKQLCGDIYVSDKVKSELQKAIASLEQDERRPFPECCDLSIADQHDRSRTPHGLADVVDLVMEDHAKNTIKYSEYFTGKPAVVVFFYTRCDNPNKCSLTITRLGELQKSLVAAGLKCKIKIAAITYDPPYDRAFRLESYCTNRGMALDDDNRAFRIPAGMPQMLSYFDSGVNYIGSIVNQHATELFIVGSDGQITNRFQQLQWQVTEVLAQLRKQLTRDRRRTVFPRSVRSLLRNTVSFLASVSIAFLPKCPLCWASYVSVLGVTDIQILNFTPWLLPALVVLLVIQLFSLLKGADRRNGLLPFFLGLSGALCILLFTLWMNVRWSGYIGTALILSGSVLNSLDPYVFTRMRLRVMRVRAALHLP